ncbi:PadR family transcriptional regulator [Moorena sp. SIO3I6]|uniref:PadR family transcriptional regulator n=1 Tax=Moorena sp. SIO3I6 TaxID=2607831 RepID=UPI00344DB592
MFQQTIDISARAAPKDLREGNSYDKPVQTIPPQTELLILWAIQKSDPKGVYGLDIQRAFRECSGGNESISLGSLYSLLKRMRKKGYVKSCEGDAIGGGAKRQYYSLTETGESVVRYADEFFARLRNWSP